jgi:hypothetical protein
MPTCAAALVAAATTWWDPEVRTITCMPCQDTGD